MNKTELLELAGQCEKATGPDRELDADIGRYLASVGTFSCWGCDDPLRFTASLDAAMTLIESSDEWELSTIYGLARATVGLNRDHETAWPGHGEHKGGLPALALTAASLRALAAQESDHG